MGATEVLIDAAADYFHQRGFQAVIIAATLPIAFGVLDLTAQPSDRGRILIQPVAIMRAAFRECREPVDLLNERVDPSTVIERTAWPRSREITPLCQVPRRAPQATRRPTVFATKCGTAQ